ncbi:neuropeptide Y receptor type 5-like [Anguilla anguilla]|uniref:neuropeptide Y receptor type 5-like n=1 Tax=Anguilla anguilla TaxID=7936 RepID=UPI0015AE61BB|nr:neuropeptide Y receptor type 5-like [Anguilla anguilla]
MDSGYINASENPIDNATMLLYNSYMALWEDFDSSVNDMRYFLIGLYTTVSVLGLLGNVLILTALARKWREKSIINLLVGNLAFSDILVVLFCSPFTLTSVLLDHWVFGEVMCHVVPFLQCVSVVVSTLVLMSIAMVRYHMISRPLSAHMSVHSGYVLLAAIWMLGLSICSPLPVFHRTVDVSRAFRLGPPRRSKWLCVESWPSGAYRVAFTLGLLLVQYILPVVCLTASHATVCRRVWAGELAQPGQPLGPAEENEAIRLTLPPPAERRGRRLPRRVSAPEGWSLGPAGGKERRRYSRKGCAVGPVAGRDRVSGGSRGSGEGAAAWDGDGDGDRRPPPLLRVPQPGPLPPNVPVCFEELKEEEWRTALTAARTSVSRARRRSRVVFLKLTAVVLAFAVSWMPLHVFHLLTDFSTDLISSRHFKLVYCICHLLGMLSCCLNPVLYGFLNNGIKSDLLSLIRCL